MTDERLRDLVKRLLIDFQGYNSAFEACDPWSVSGEELEADLIEAVGWTRDDLERARDKADLARRSQATR